MAKFSKTSSKKLSTCHPDLRLLALTVVRFYDCTVVCGQRGEESQNEAVDKGYSKLSYPDSKHNKEPLSDAIDLAPYLKGKGVVYDYHQCYHFAGFVMATAQMLGIKIRWGGDWDGDLDVNDQTFLDLVHFERVG